MSDRAALLSFGNTIDLRIHRSVTELYRRITEYNFKGFIESVPAYSSIAVFYDPLSVLENNSGVISAYDFVVSFLTKACDEVGDENSPLSLPVIEIPVLYDGPDLHFISEQKKLSVEEIIERHIAPTYNVFMIGFLPGFAYMGTVDEKIAVPRKSSPRLVVPPGSVGIAGNQTGIYPQASPGGWQLIGRTPRKIFDAQKHDPCLFQPGSRVKFHPIQASDFTDLDEY